MMEKHNDMKSVGAFSNSAQSVLNKTCLCPEICSDRYEFPNAIRTDLGLTQSNSTRHNNYHYSE